jgi:uncharacterized phage infection (PIP) family protein YhgE
MVREIRRQLSSVRARQRQVKAVDWLVRGVVIGASAGVAVEIARMCGAPVTYSACWMVLLSCTAVCGVIGWLLPVSWTSSAHLVDAHYRLKDSATSALDFAARKSTEPLMQLQIANAIQDLQRVDAKAVLPYRTPKWMPAAVGLCALLIALPFLPREQQTAPTIDTAVQQIVNDQATTLDETMVEELRELAEQTKEPELKALVEEIEKLVEAMKSPEMDQREALAKLSEMQQNLAEALNQFNAEKTDADLKELAAALESAESMQAIAEALKDGKYEKAAEQLEKIDASSLTRKEREAVAANLKKFRENLGEGKKGELSESAQEMQEGLEKENASQCKDGQCKAAGVCKKQGLKKSIANCLNCQLNRLSECKSQCQSQCSGGAVKKSTQDSNKVGKAASNKPLGEEATKLDSTRHEENITGVQGEGSSERETTQSPEGEQDAARSYQAKYTEFRKQMEEVIDSEPLPLGHRETVRKYFESIRPASGDVTE